jgi:hypothetical protein
MSDQQKPGIRMVSCLLMHEDTSALDGGIQNCLLAKQHSQTFESCLDLGGTLEELQIAEPIALFFEPGRHAVATAIEQELEARNSFLMSLVMAFTQEGSCAFFHLIIDARPTPWLDGRAFAQWKNGLEILHRLSGNRRRSEGAEVDRFIVLNTACNLHVRLFHG